MRYAYSWLVVLALPLACCAPVGPPPPSLLARPAEAIDPRLPVSPATMPAPVDQGLIAPLAMLVDRARTGDTRFRTAATQAQRLAEAAGTRQSESWIVAQEAMSAASAARVETTQALADIDSLAATAVQRTGTIPPADLAAIQSASAEVGQIEASQASLLEQISRRLGL